MIQIHYDEVSNEIKIGVEPGGENEKMTLEKLVCSLVGIVGGMAGFLRDEFGEKTMNAFFDAIRELDKSGLLGIVAVADDDEMNKQR